MSDFIEDCARLEDWQASPEGMVAAQVSALVQSVSDLWESSLHGERMLYVPPERNDIHLSYVRLGRLLSRIQPVSEAAE